MDTDDRNSTGPLSVSWGRLEIRFLGREAPADRWAALRKQLGGPRELAYLRQVHSARVLPAAVGLRGDGDGLWSSTSNLALGIATADCVPLVIADQKRLAIVHAGWRGIVSGIVQQAVHVLGSTSGLTAWIGPAIRGCCYEVGEDVACQLVAASDRSVLSPASGRRPFVDPVTAVSVQLRNAGIRSICSLASCTRCNADEFWSYRRDGAAAGRNYSLAWFTGGADEVSA